MTTPSPDRAPRVGTSPYPHPVLVVLGRTTINELASRYGFRSVELLLACIRAGHRVVDEYNVFHLNSPLEAADLEVLAEALPGVDFYVYREIAPGARSCATTKNMPWARGDNLVALARRSGDQVNDMVKVLGPEARRRVYFSVGDAYQPTEGEVIRLACKLGWSLYVRHMTQRERMQAAFDASPEEVADAAVAMAKRDRAAAGGLACLTVGQRRRRRWARKHLRPEPPIDLRSEVTLLRAGNEQLRLGHQKFIDDVARHLDMLDGSHPWDVLRALERQLARLRALEAHEAGQYPT